MGGVPCIRDLRFPVATVVGMVADGMKDGEILQACPDLEVSDIREALQRDAEVESNPSLGISLQQVDEGIRRRIRRLQR